MISGSELAPGQAAARYIAPTAARALDGRGNTTHGFGAGRRAGQWRDGAFGRNRRFPQRSRSHPGCSVCRGARRREEFGIDGARLLRAVTLGYDIGPRVCWRWRRRLQLREQPRHPQHFRTFGSAAAAACAPVSMPSRCAGARLHRAAIFRIVTGARHRSHREAFAFAACRAERVTSALLVQTGWNGVDDTFSGPGNFFQPTRRKLSPIS